MESLSRTASTPVPSAVKGVVSGLKFAPRLVLTAVSAVSVLTISAVAFDTFCAIVLAPSVAGTSSESRLPLGATSAATAFVRGVTLAVLSAFTVIVGTMAKVRVVTPSVVSVATTISGAFRPVTSIGVPRVFSGGDLSGKLPNAIRT